MTLLLSDKTELLKQSRIAIESNNELRPWLTKLLVEAQLIAALLSDPNDQDIMIFAPNCVARKYSEVSFVVSYNRVGGRKVPVVVRTVPCNVCNEPQILLPSEIKDKSVQPDIQYEAVDLFKRICRIFAVDSIEPAYVFVPKDNERDTALVQKLRHMHSKAMKKAFDHCRVLTKSVPLFKDLQTPVLIQVPVG
jgi:hypothetical protein